MTDPKKLDTPVKNGWDIKHIAPILIVLALAAIPFGYGKYIEFNMHGAFDAGLNVYHAQCVVDGQKIGETVFPSARPATLLLNVIGVKLFGYNDAGPKIIQMLLQLAALLLMFFTLRKAYGLYPAAGALFLAAFFLSCPPFAKYGNVKEQFMIAFMIISACSLMLHHLGGRWGWLVLSGAAAINIYFFKPTGVSVIMAMMIYLLAMPILRRRSWSKFGSDLVGLLVGLLVGFIPLALFYASQDQFLSLLRSFPGAKELGVLLATGSQTTAGSGGGYVGASRAASTFSMQFDSVMRYYRMLIVPVGFSVLAIGVGIFGAVKSIKSKSAAGHQGNFLILFIAWWVLDMLFVWISPRSYVQYYLPLNASAAMLTAVVIFRCQKTPSLLLALMGVWLLLDPLLLANRIAATESYWSNWAIQCIPLVIGIAVYFGAKPLQKNTRIIVVALASVYALLCWSGGNVKAFEQRIDAIHKMKALNQLLPWEQMGEVIRKNSQPDDGIYVWGWVPGIYVAAQRFSPATRPAYSDMHSDAPRKVGGKITQLLKDLQAKPPEFIVDAKKKHYPYNTHPNFQLWPTGVGADKKPVFITPKNYEGHQEKMLNQVEQATLQMLTHAQRPGGPVETVQAQELAQAEKARHEAMEPLRNFVMQNYQPVLPAGSPMMLFRYLPKPAQSEN